jgi:lipopolysaccharide/colanic/teichoic acid biosynthesis glycosyltransferase
MKRQSCIVTSDGSYRTEWVVPFWKRLLDLSCILLASPILGPVMLLMSLAIKVVSPGPVFFRQERVGLGGRRFTCLKFRTMKNGAGTATHEDYLTDLMRSSKPMTKMDALGDPRLIPFGLFLRSTGLDELPQVINVIRGEMSLVGPRPCTPCEFYQYKPRHLERFTTLPGLTGLWQVSGKNSTTFEQMIELDIKYARGRSLWWDALIMLKTPAVLLFQYREVNGNGKGSPKEGPKTTTSPASA